MRKRYIAAGLLCVLASLYFTGKMDPLLSNVGLNFHPCVKNGFGATFCGQDAKNYCNTLDSSGINNVNSTSADVCSQIGDQNVSSPVSNTGTTGTGATGNTALVGYPHDPNCVNGTDKYAYEVTCTPP